MKACFVTYCHDRHVDPEIKVFSDYIDAVEYARTFMKDNMAHPENIEERLFTDGYEIYLSYPEGDHAFVIETEVISPN